MFGTDTKWPEIDKNGIHLGFNPSTGMSYGIGNEWPYDWGGYYGIDWYQGGSKLSDTITVKHKSGTETTTTLAQATKTSTDVSAFAGMLVATFGFGF